MNSFPKTFTPDYDNSQILLYELNLCRLRKKIYEFVLREKEDDFFDLEKFRNNKAKNEKDMDKMTEVIRQELEGLGWKTKLIYGNTALAIYKGEGNAATWGTEF
jgi:hypothetical protein